MGAWARCLRLHAHAHNCHSTPCCTDLYPPHAACHRLPNLHACYAHSTSTPSALLPPNLPTVKGSLISSNGKFGGWSFISSASPNNLASLDAKTLLTIGTDGGVRLMNVTTKAVIWQLGYAPYGTAPYYFGVADNGRMVLADSTGKVFWTTGAGVGSGPFYLSVAAGQMKEMDSTGKVGEPGARLRMEGTGGGDACC